MLHHLFQRCADWFEGKHIIQAAATAATVHPEPSVPYDKKKTLLILVLSELHTIEMPDKYRTLLRELTLKLHNHTETDPEDYLVGQDHYDEIYNQIRIFEEKHQITIAEFHKMYDKTTTRLRELLEMVNEERL